MKEQRRETQNIYSKEMDNEEERNNKKKVT